MKKKDLLTGRYMLGGTFNSANCHAFNSANCHAFISGTYDEKNPSFRVDKGENLGFDVLEWEITSSCSLAREIGPCKFCYASSKHKRSNELSQEARIKMVKLFASRYFKQLIIGGGEPLDIGISNLSEIVNIANYYGLQTFLSTSGYNFSLKCAYLLEDAGLNGISISLDGSTPEIHAISRSKETFSKAINAIEFCVKTGLRTSITMVINRFNFDDFKNMVNLASGLGVAELYTIPLMPVGRALEFQEAFLSPKMKAEHIKRVLKTNKSQNLKIEISSPQKNIHAFQDNFVPTHPLGCSAGVADLGLLPDGTIVDCPIHRYCLGYWEDFIYGKPLLETLRKNRIFNSLQNRDIQGKCGSCDHLLICGGCRAESEALTGNPLGGEYNCEFYSARKTKNAIILEKSLTPLAGVSSK